MSFARAWLIFCYGLFSIAAQTLLFREFITTFEGNDISVGIFFGSWFLWVGVGAALVSKTASLAERLTKHIEVLFLLYLPAFAVQMILILQARALAGVESYILLPIRTVLLLSVLINAPLSLVTGGLFPLACRWVQKEQSLAIGRVYMLEAAGSFVGGLGVTILLGLGVDSISLFLMLALVLCTGVLAVLSRNISSRRQRLKAWFAAVLVAAAAVCLYNGDNKRLMQYVQVLKWSRLLPAETLRGSFHTTQAEYLYGDYNGQWVVMREGSTVESLPDEASAGRTAAMTLCQNPRASKVLVVGSGLNLCRQLLRLEQIRHVTWMHCDSEYVRKINAFLPSNYHIRDERMEFCDDDVRSLLAARRQFYDIVIINLPEATSSVLNRFYTREFYGRIKESLRAGGIAAVRITGGENILQTELISLGASTQKTLEKVFSRLVLSPGDDTWFIASDSNDISDDPYVLRDRFAGIVGSAEVFRANGLLSVYRPERAAFALENYAASDLPERLLLNTDSRPLTHLYSLLLAARQSGAPVTRLVKMLAFAGPMPFAVPIVVVVLLRIIYLWRNRIWQKTNRCVPESISPARYGGSFDSTFLVFSAGLVGIGVVIVLMYLYQTRFGSLYLHVGVISSIFMVGLTAGAALAAQTRKLHVPTERLIIAVILIHAAILGAIAFWPLEDYSHALFAGAFLLSGLGTGTYFPLAARQLGQSTFDTTTAAGKLETADHLGAAIGAVITSLAIVPVLGAKVTLGIFILLMGANGVTLVWPARKSPEASAITPPQGRIRNLGYILFGVGLSIVLCSNILVHASAGMTATLSRSSAQALAGQAAIEQQSVAGNARRVTYFRVLDAGGKTTGYIFSSEDFAPQVRGFGGRMNLAVYIDDSGKLINFHIVRSNETPAYLEMLSDWWERLKHRPLFGRQSFSDVQAVTGATISSKAVMEALQLSAQKFAAESLGLNIEASGEPAVQKASAGLDPAVPYLVFVFVLSLLVIYWGGFWSRLAVLTFNLVVGGIILNAQFSTEQVMTLLSLQSPAVGLSAAFLLMAAMPIAILLAGNIYCGYLCPFGALQELLGYIVPARFKPALSRRDMKKPRFAKYVMLWVLVMLFFVLRRRTVLEADPLIAVFSLRLHAGDIGPILAVILGVAVVGSLFYERFWCRYLCPAGAFLSLVNGVAILSRYLPKKKFGRCEFGVTAADPVDCIQCDRCRYNVKSSIMEATSPHVVKQRVGPRFLAVCVVTAAVLVAGVSVSRFTIAMPSSVEPLASSAASGGKPRDVDTQRMRTLIREKKLSDKEADYYRKGE